MAYAIDHFLVIYLIIECVAVEGFIDTAATLVNRVAEISF